MAGFRLELVAGASRSGKTFLTADRISREKNVLVWDTMGEFATSYKCKRVTADTQLRSIAARGLPGRWAFDCRVTPENFDVFCRCAWLWIRVMAHRKQRVVIVVEELADVTPPGKAPPAWGDIIRKSLRFNPYILALTQSPAESDKTVMRNATVLRCHGMQRADDRKAMARELDIDQSVVDALDFDKFQYVERDRRTRKLTTAGKGIKLRTVK